MAAIRIPVKKSLTTLVLVGLLSLAAAGSAGAASGAPGVKSLPGTAKGNCARVQSDLTRMHHRQALLAAKIAKLESAGSRATTAGKAHRAAVIHHNLLHWQRMQSRKINARFLRREAALTALASGRCQATASPSSAPTTTGSGGPLTPTSVPAGTVTA